MSSTAATGVDGRGPAEQMASDLANRIYAGVLAPGTRLREVSLAQEAGVSRDTARHAIRILSRMGLAVHERHRGATVLRLRPSDVTDLYRVRAILELTAVDARSITPVTRLIQLEETFDQLRRARSRSTAEELSRLDLDLHAAIVGLHDSPRMDAYFATIASGVRFCMAVTSLSGADPVSTKEKVANHAPIVAALLKNQPIEAKELLANHLSFNERRTLTVLAERGERSASKQARMPSGTY